MARYCSKCKKQLWFFQEDYNGMCYECYERKEKIEKKDNLEKKFADIKNRIIEYAPLMEIYSRITEVQISLGLYKNEYQSVNIILKEVLKKLIEMLPIGFTKEDINSVNNMETLLEVAEEINYMLKEDYEVNTNIIKRNEDYDASAQIFYEYIR